VLPNLSKSIYGHDETGRRPIEQTLGIDLRNTGIWLREANRRMS
jgi:hypothetical protein